MSRSSCRAHFPRVALIFLLLAGCGHVKVASYSEPEEIIYTVKAEGDRSVVRLITRAESCPDVVWDDRPQERMNVRASPATIARRGDGAQSETKSTKFDILTCEVLWRAGAKGATINKRTVPAPISPVRRIVLIGDTGCRMKASENAFQDCNDPAQWPFAEVARSAAALKPDLVVHVGDIHYRESPCPVGNAGCADSPWGYGFDAWEADLFKPAAPLLSAAPWLFVRGNHESCSRAGQGWFRFIDAAPFRAERSCDSPINDRGADYTEPFAVPLGRSDQLIVFDSSRSSGKAYLPTDPAFLTYAEQIRAVDVLAKSAKRSYFLSHHPLLAYAPQKRQQGTGNVARPGGSQGLQSAFGSVFPNRLFPDAVDVVLHGHVHLFELLGFSSAHPTSLILGNSGSMMEGRAPQSAKETPAPYPSAIVEHYASHSEFGFALLERNAIATGDEWTLTEYDVHGRTVLSCQLLGSKTRCESN